MTTSEKVAYLKGFADGLGLDKENKQDKLIAAIIDVSVETDADSPVALHRVLVNHARGSTILRGSTELRWDAADRTRATLARLIDERRGAAGRA